MANVKFSVLGLDATVSEAANAEVNPDQTDMEALAMAIVAGGHSEIGGGDHLHDGSEFEYSATAEDNGIAGAYDLEPGLIFRGPANLYTTVKVTVSDVDVTEGAITLPETTDEVTLALHVNSALWAIADEGFVENGAAAIVTEFNVSADLALTEADVIRLVLLSPTGDESEIDYDVSATGTVEII